MATTIANSLNSQALNPTVPAHNNDNHKATEDKPNGPLDFLDTSLFTSLQNFRLDELQGKNLDEVLPFLVKLILNPYFSRKKDVLKLIFHSKRANDVIQLLKTRVIEPQDIMTNGSLHIEARLFESSSPDDRLKLVALEYIRIQDIARQSNLNANQNAKLQYSVLFDNPLYVNDIVLCMFALLNKTSSIPVMNILDVSEALLHVKYGPTYIARLVINMPEKCQEVCQSLITFGEKQDECEKVNEISDQRAKTLRILCKMNPSMAFTVRSLTLQMCKMPSLTIMITLDRLERSMEQYNQVVGSSTNDVNDSISDQDRARLLAVTTSLEDSYDSAISFITGILLGVEDSTKTWFAQYIKSAQQKRIDQSHFTILSVFRKLLLSYVQTLFPCFLDIDTLDYNTINQAKVDQNEDTKEYVNRKLIQATATLRLYCALRGIGLLKLNHEESETLLRLVTCRQKASQTSINLATTGICTLLVCSSLISNQKDEKRAAEWLKWLIKESHFSEDSHTNHGKCSISELLLLMAIHFQNNQTNQIAELVHATLGLKLQTKASVSKCKPLFVQEVFTDQMIAEHAVRVPVTKNLDNSIKEFLPIHCIHQLLECRSFSKHQVPIKDWIFKQICESRKPLHHMLPELINAYVNSLIIPTSALGHCGTNQPIPECDIMQIFHHRLYSSYKSAATNRHANTPNHHDKISSGNDRNQKKSRRDRMDIDESPMSTIKNQSSDRISAENISIIDMEVAQILMLYYLMLYEDVRLKKSFELSAQEREKLITYSASFMMDIPVFYLLQVVRDNQEHYGSILPSMLRLVSTQYPQLCSIQHWLNVTDHYESYKSKTVSSTNLDGIKSSPQPTEKSQRMTKKSSLTNGTTPTSDSSNSILKTQLKDGFSNISQQPQNLIKTINSVLSMPRDEIWIYADTFITNWAKLLDVKTLDSIEHAKLLKSITKLWWKLNTIFPRKLWVMTINSLRMLQNGIKIVGVKSLEYSWDELTADPLIVLRCDERVFRTPEYLNILLHILTAFLAASRRCLQDQLSEQTTRQKDVMRDRGFEELKTTLVLAQTSAAIQILLESCLPRDQVESMSIECNSNDTLNNKGIKIDGSLCSEQKSALQQFKSSVVCICEHLHQVFIADTNLAKLVHFQTYPSELLATTCENIPSMHICIDFIPELLGQPDLVKQVFTIELTSHLCEKYPITSALNVAKLCFNVAYTLLQLLPSDKRPQFYTPTLPALLRMCKVFPILHEDARIILNQINQISLAHMASTSSRLSLGSSRPFEGLDQMSWSEVKALMKSRLSPNEGLYLCVQKCLLDLDKMEDQDKQQMQQLILQNQSLTTSAPSYNSIFAYGDHVTNY